MRLFYKSTIAEVISRLIYKEDSFATILIIIEVIFRVKIPNISCFQLLICEDLLLIYNNKAVKGTFFCSFF